jgi:predicted MPP superfamily phosphohydrolase
MTRKKRRAFYVLGAILIICLALASWAFLIEPNRLVIHSETISLPHWPNTLNGLRIAAISDIHAGSAFIDAEKIRQVVAKTNAERPDLIVLLGDFVVTGQVLKHTVQPEVVAQPLKVLRAPGGVYAVLGNHDWTYDGPRVRHALEDVGIKVLDNEAAQVEINGNTLWFCGLADAWTGSPDIKGTLAKVPSGAPVIVLTHNPDLFASMPASVSLTLAGHTHGGQVNLPLLGRLVVPSNYGQRYAAGLVEEEGKSLFVTTGIGTSILPVRFRVPPEIAILTINTR